MLSKSLCLVLFLCAREAIGVIDIWITKFFTPVAGHESEGVWNASTESSCAVNPIEKAFAGCVEHRGGLFCIFPHQNIFAVLALDDLCEHVESKLRSESVSIIRAGSKYVGALQEPIYEASE